jgi:hypothetical protein
MDAAGATPNRKSLAREPAHMFVEWALADQLTGSTISCSEVDSERIDGAAT